MDRQTGTVSRIGITLRWLLNLYDFLMIMLEEIFKMSDAFYLFESYNHLCGSTFVNDP